MKRRGFLQALTLAGGSVLSIPQTSVARGLSTIEGTAAVPGEQKSTMHVDVAVIGAGLGGLAATLALLKAGKRVLLTEETNWIGGQLTAQGVPPDEHPWIESHGAPQSYLDFRHDIRNFYLNHYPVVDAQREQAFFNPGNGSVSKLCTEPRVALQILEAKLAPFLSNGQLSLWLNSKAVAATVEGTQVRSLTILDSKGVRCQVQAAYFVDATELGELLPMTGTDYVTGTESKAQTQELHAPEVGSPTNNQSFTMCFAVDYQDGENHVIPKPIQYDFWKKHIPSLQPAWSGPLLDLHYSNPRTLEKKLLGFNPENEDSPGLLNLWQYRRIIDKTNFKPGFYAGDISIINWPQNDYMLGNIIDVPAAEYQKHVNNAKQLSLSLLYWLQTEAPRGDGNKGWPGLRLRKDIMDSADGLAKYPYIRESRRIKAEFTITEAHVGKDNRRLVAGPGEDPNKACVFEDSVGIGYYPIDLHPTTEGNNYIDFEALPFQIPLGALLPIRMDNILPANKNIGTTHISNGCYRLHPVEWSIGEAVGHLLFFAQQQKLLPRSVWKEKEQLKDFQNYLLRQGVPLQWADGK